MLITVLTVGTLDIIGASIQTLVNKGSPFRLLQFIASGVFGRKAFDGGLPYAIAGLMLHFLIVSIWVGLFFFLYNKNYIPKINKVIIAFLYVCIIWLVMTFIVLPLSNTPPLPFSIAGSVIGILILFLAIGLPLTYLAPLYMKKG